MNLALFDFDGTLTSKDSLVGFLKYSVSGYRYLINMLRFLPYLILWKLKLMDNGIAKEHLFRIFFKGTNEDIFKAKAKEFSLNELDTMMNEQRVEILKKHQINGDRVIVVSASMRCWLEPWCDKNGIELISTRLEFKNGYFTGRFSTKNCDKEEKTRRIKELLDIKDYESIYAYGDSSGDDDMLKLADIAVKY